MTNSEMRSGSPKPYLKFFRATTASWLDLRSEWKRLHCAQKTPTFFLSPTWMDAWFKHYGAETEAEFVCLFVNERIEGLCLLTLSHTRRRCIPILAVGLNTTSYPLSLPWLEHNGILCASSRQAEFARLLVDHLANKSYEILILPGIHRVLFDDVTCHLRVPITHKSREAPFINLEVLRKSNQNILESLSKNSRHQIRRSIKLYERRGPLVCEKAETADKAAEFFTEMLQLHSETWGGRGVRSAFLEDTEQLFHKEIVVRGTEMGGVQISKITAGSDTVGILYNLCQNGHISYYQSGFRYEENNKLKPGLVCHAMAAQQALEHGAREYDFLSVADIGARYKASLANDSRNLFWLEAKSISAKNFLIKLIDLIVGIGKQ